MLLSDLPAGTNSNETLNPSSKKGPILHSFSLDLSCINKEKDNNRSRGVTMPLHSAGARPHLGVFSLILHTRPLLQERH